VVKLWGGTGHDAHSSQWIFFDRFFMIIFTLGFRFGNRPLESAVVGSDFESSLAEMLGYTVVIALLSCNCIR